MLLTNGLLDGGIGMGSETKLVARYQETDQMGIVHHSVYPIWFECGRTDYIKSVGMSYGQMEKEGVKLPLLSMQCRFLHPSFYEDAITIKTYIVGLTPTRITFGYDVFREGTENPVARGETEHAWTDCSLRPVNLKKFRPQLLQLMQELYAKEGSNERE